MFKNYLKIALRNMGRQKLYSLINITGLATGLAVCMMIMLYVAHETTYDRFHKNAANVFMPHAQIKMAGNTMNMTYCSYVSGPMIKAGQPMVASYMRTLGYFRQIAVSRPEVSAEKFNADKLLFADANFFDFFSFKLKEGSVKDVLNKPFTVVLSADMAQKYFNGQDPVGKTIVIKTDSAYTYQVTGVAENAPSNSSIKYNFVTSNESLLAMKEGRNYLGANFIGPGSFGLYLQLNKGADTAKLCKNLDQMVLKNKYGDSEKFFMMGLPDAHLHFNTDDSSTKYLKIFPLVAGLILLLALVNYMSLSTARATLRAKEVGVRKVNGASRKAIAIQFYVESALYACLSFVLGYVLFYIFKPVFFNVLELPVDNSFLYNPMVMLLMLGLLLLTILVAGGYPSLILSSFKPVVTLKGKMSKQAGGVTVRKIFTTLQFTISVALIICGIIIDRQLYFFRHTDIGVNKDNVVMIPISNGFLKNYPAFKKDVSDLAGVSNVATSHYAMFGGFDMYSIDGKTPKDGPTMLSSLAVGSTFIKTMGIKWKYPPVSDLKMNGKDKVVINELAITQLNLPVNPVGNYIKSGNQKLEVIGVVKDFNYSSLEYPNSGLGLFILSDTSRLWSRSGCNLFARIKPHTNIPTLLDRIKNDYRKYDPDAPFNYTFMDDAFNQQFKAEDRLASIFSIFTVITIVLATLGLFGLAAFTIEQRTKEIGVRKVLGASVSAIATLLSADFLKLVLLASLIASPIAWWTMHKWLQDFAYRITIPWWAFVVSGAIAVIAAVVTVSYHSVKAALTSPVKSLRSE